MSDVLETLADLTLVLSAAILVVLTLRPIVRRAFGARGAYALWLMIPMVLVAVAVPARSIPAPELAMLFEPMPNIEIAAYTEPVEPTSFSSPARTLDVDPADRETFTSHPLWILVWLFGIVAYGVLMRLRHKRFMNRLGALSPTRHADVLRSNHGDFGPVLIGVIRPKIVIPNTFESCFSPDQQALVLAHERCHRAHLDPLTNAAFASIAAVFWFNPLVHFAQSRFRSDQELARDAIVIAEYSGSKRAYAEALLRAQTWKSTGSILTCQWTSHHPLINRISALSKPVPSQFRRFSGFGLVMAISLSGASFAWAGKPAMLATSTAAYGSPLSVPHALVSVHTFEASSLDIKLSEQLNIVAENRANIALEVYTDLPIETVVEGSKLLLWRMATSDCKDWLKEQEQFPDPKPQFVVRVPATLDIDFRGPVSARISGAKGGRVASNDCGVIGINRVEGNFTLIGSEQTRFAVQGVQGDLDLRQRGSSRSHIDEVVGDLRGSLEDTSEIVLGSVSGTVALSLFGDSHGSIRKLNGDAELEAMGASSLIIDDLQASETEISVFGDSDLLINAGHGANLALEIAGASRARIDGSIKNLNLESSTDGNLRFERVETWNVIQDPQKTGELWINGQNVPP